MEGVKKILVSEDGRIFYVRNLDADFHTMYGFIKKGELIKKDGLRILSSTGKGFHIFSPSFIDSYKRIKRAPQIIPLKDIAAIIAETGVNKKSVAVDAGTGSGALACFLANYVKKVVSYEIRRDFSEIASENIKLLGLKNVKIKNRDVYKGIDEKDVDLVVFDLPEPWNAIDGAERALRIGGFLVSYSPLIPKMIDFSTAMRKHKNFVYLKTIEIMERQWEVWDERVRPRSQQGSSGFLSFYRKIY